MELITGTGVILGLIMVVLAMLLPVLALIDILKSRFEGNNKLIWVIIVLCLNFLGFILYIAIGRKQRVVNE